MRTRRWAGTEKARARSSDGPIFAKTEIYLPEVLRVEDGSVRKLDYEQDILFALDWSGLDPAPLVAKIPDNFAEPGATDAAHPPGGFG